MSVALIFKTEQTITFRVSDDPLRLGIDLYCYIQYVGEDKNGSKRTIKVENYHTPTVEEIKPGEMARPLIAFDGIVGPETLQKVFNDLWALGLRPSKFDETRELVKLALNELLQKKAKSEMNNEE